jgi:hypothetical protein
MVPLLSHGSSFSRKLHFQQVTVLSNSQIRVQCVCTFMAFIIIYELTSKGSHFHPGNLTYGFPYPHMHRDKITALLLFQRAGGSSFRCQYGPYQTIYHVSEKSQMPEGSIASPLSIPKTCLDLSCLLTLAYAVTLARNVLYQSPISRLSHPNSWV